MDAFSFFILGLATWRSACIITREDGPLMAFYRLREAAMTRWPAPGSVGELLTCPYCTSVWLGGIATVAWCLLPTATTLLALPLALSGVAAAIERTLDTGDDEEEPSSLVD